MNIKEFLKNEIKKTEEDLTNSDISAYYYERYSEDEGPFSMGNYEDVYSDGYEAGLKDGKYGLMVELLQIINSQDIN